MYCVSDALLRAGGAAQARPDSDIAAGSERWRGRIDVLAQHVGLVPKRSLQSAGQHVAVRCTTHAWGSSWDCAGKWFTVQ